VRILPALRSGAAAAAAPRWCGAATATSSAAERCHDDNNDTADAAAVADVNDVSVNDDASDDVPLVVSSRSSLSAPWRERHIDERAAVGAALLVGRAGSARSCRLRSCRSRWCSTVPSSLTQCDEIDRSLSVLAADARELCVRDGLINPLYSKWRALALYGLAPYVSLIVVALPLITWRRHARPHARLWRNKMRWGFLSDGYRPRFHYWECVILARRITFGCSARCCRSTASCASRRCWPRAWWRCRRT
jgi:hypothetical protein